MLTSYLRELPDFIIIGANKSGTSSLYDFVTRHPAIAPASEKEPRYFSMRYKFGKLWYRSNFPTKLSGYFFTKRTRQKLLSGEASTSYFFHPMVASRMKKVLPNVKLIIILRNPVDRAYSHYHYSMKLHRETLSFEKGIELEEKRCAKERESLIKDPDFTPTCYHYNSYLAKGIYADQLEDWFGYYSRKQFLILSTEDFRKNPQQILDQIFDFLGVIPFSVKNLKDLNVGNYKEMNEDTRKFLVKYFKPHNERLYKLLQRRFDWDK